ncbi:hypothetical protein M758_12G132800 [Ceratodon purpureus]|nr:hypothetical protein M758_12G132800 [Ceratodon purpureus]
MGRMKPAALLQHSKKKKGPAKLNMATVVVAGVVIILCLSSFMVLHRHKTRGNIDGAGDDNIRNIADDKGAQEAFGVENNAVEALPESHLPRYATLNTTKGSITVEFFGKQAPLTVENFATHSKKGYYNGVLFHRIIKDFMIQSGDPGGDGTGGESIWGGSFKDEFTEELTHEAFTLSMANIGEANSNRSQFFITTIATPHLNMKHTVFGRVVRGKEVVQAIERVETDQQDRPLSPVYINDIRVHDEL